MDFSRSVIDHDKIRAHMMAYLDEQRQLRQAGGHVAVNNTSNVCLPPPYDCDKNNTTSSNSSSSSSNEDAILDDVAFLHGLLRWFKVTISPPPPLITLISSLIPLLILFSHPGRFFQMGQQATLRQPFLSSRHRPYGRNRW